MADVTSFSEALSRLKCIRDGSLRNSREVVCLWKQFLAKRVNSLGDDKWLILEQVFISALDVADDRTAEDAFCKLEAQFPRSNRLQRLKAMIYEAKQNFTKAEEIYSQILEADPVDFKRMVAIHKAQGKINEAVQALNKYLEVNSMDFEAWLELSELYLSQLDYDKAAFCVEELILINPHNHLFHLRYADIKYSQGDFEMARLYYCQASKLSTANVRAPYGVLLCSQKLSASKSKDKSSNISIARKASEELNTKYKNSGSPTAAIQVKATEAIIDSISGQ